jgi:hypothetical protein
MPVGDRLIPPCKLAAGLLPPSASRRRFPLPNAEKPPLKSQFDDGSVTHEMEPAGDFLPPAQFLHVADDEALVAAEKVFAGHLVHATAPVKEYVPERQPTHLEEASAPVFEL